jgi:TolA-binding protein
MAEESTETSRPLAEISHGPSAFEAFLDRNQKGLVVGAILLALVGAAVIVVRGLKQAKIEEAGAAFGKATTITELQQVIQKYPDSPVAGSAKVVLADKQWAEQDLDGSVETLRSFIAANPEHPAVPSAKASLATRLVHQDKAADAEPIFHELADSSKSTYLAPYALIALGDIAKAAGKPEEAEASYKRVQETFGAPFAAIAANHRRLVRFKMPAEIEPPPPHRRRCPLPGPPRRLPASRIFPVPTSLMRPSLLAARATRWKTS